MKNLFILISILLLSVILPNCTPINGGLDRDDKCDLTIQPLINATFNISFNVMYKADNEDATNIPVKIEIEKTYCNTEKNGLFINSGDTNQDGYWRSNMQYTYKFQNTYDRVTLLIRITGPNNKQYIHVYEYTYEDVKDDPNMNVREYFYID